MKLLLIAIGWAVVSANDITYAQDANSEQEQFDARIEQQISESYENGYTVEKTGNTVRLTNTIDPQTTLGYRAL